MTGEGFDKTRNGQPYQKFTFANDGVFTTTDPQASNVVCLRNLTRTLLDFKNGLNQQVAVQIHTAHKENMEEPYLVKPAFNLAAGARQIETLGDPWGFVRITVTPALAPTAGAFKAELEGSDH